MDGFHGSLVENMLKETEKLHAKMGRYKKSPDEHPFFSDGLPEPMLPPLDYPKDKEKLMDILTYREVEEAIKKRVEEKAKDYGKEKVPDGKDHQNEPVYKIEPSLVADLYSDWIMPLTKQVQVAYLLRRLD